MSDTGRLRFSHLKIRPKLIVLHNIFFLVLTAAVYFTLIPLIEQRIGAVAALDPRLAGELVAVVSYARWTLALVLFVVYVLAVAALEFLVMPPAMRTTAIDRKSTRLNSSHLAVSRMPSSA